MDTGANLVLKTVDLIENEKEAPFRQNNSGILKTAPKLTKKIPESIGLPVLKISMLLFEGLIHTLQHGHNS